MVELLPDERITPAENEGGRQSLVESLGLEQYSKALGTNDIDSLTLLSLDRDNLKKYGVASLGHRKKKFEASDVP